jgi:hypothetical protein
MLNEKNSKFFSLDGVGGKTLKGKTTVLKLGRVYEVIATIMLSRLPGGILCARVHSS